MMVNPFLIQGINSSYRISEKILNLSNVIYKKTCEVLVCSENEFKVINHGDVWTNNFLFRYDKQGKPIEQAFVSDPLRCNNLFRILEWNTGL